MLRHLPCYANQRRYGSACFNAQWLFETVENTVRTTMPPHTKAPYKKSNARAGLLQNNTFHIPRVVQ